MKNAVAEFEPIWRRFEECVHGKLISKSKGKELICSSANNALKEASLEWFEPYSINGIWLSKLLNEDRVKGENLTNILKNKINFEEVRESKSISKAITYGVPIAASVATCAVTNVLGGNIIKQLVSLTVPSAVLFPVMNISEKNLKQREDKLKINAYLAQLDKYKKDIIDILSV